MMVDFQGKYIYIYGVNNMFIYIQAKSIKLATIQNTSSPQWAFLMIHSVFPASH